MSKYTLRKSINRAFTSSLIDNYIIRQQEEKLAIYANAQSVALEEGDIEEVEKIEKKISALLTDKIE
jgi:hypothetical protein